MRIKRDTRYGYGTYEWQESTYRLEQLAWLYSYHNESTFSGAKIGFDYSITYDFEG